MFLIVKRFEMDDIPMQLCKTREEAEKVCQAFKETINQASDEKREELLHASENDQELVSENISSPLVALWIFEFDENGLPSHAWIDSHYC